MQQFVPRTITKNISEQLIIRVLYKKYRSPGSNTPWVISQLTRTCRMSVKCFTFISHNHRILSFTTYLVIRWIMNYFVDNGTNSNPVKRGNKPIYHCWYMHIFYYPMWQVARYSTLYNCFEIINISYLSFFNGILYSIYLYIIIYIQEINLYLKKQFLYV